MAITLTKAQADHVAWALDPMVDHWTTPDGAHDRGGDVLPESALPILRGRVLEVDHVTTDVVEDLLYRLEVQLPDVADAEGVRLPAADRAASKIRNAVDARADR